jgi:hypothetical protein
MPIRKISPINNNSITQEEFNEIYFTNTTPVQLTDLDKTMPIFKKWSFDYFKEIGKNFMCQVSDNLNEPAKITRKLPISEYISLIQSGEKCPYMIGWSYQKDFHQLDEDFSLPKIQPFDFINTLPRHLQFRRQWIFFGKKDINSDLHIDCFSTSAWILMAQGTKTFRGISPLDRHHIDMGSSLFDEQVIAYLNEKRVAILEFKLTPGTILYIPTGWVHQIKNEEDNIMVTGGFTSDKHVFRFFHNFHETILRDSRESEQIYLTYLNKFIDQPQTLSPEVIDSIERDLNLTQMRIEELHQKIGVYKTLLSGR